MSDFGGVFFIFVLVLFLVCCILMGVYNCELGHPGSFLYKSPNFCGECGEALRFACPDCSASYTVPHTFCTECGYEFSREG